MQEKNEYRNDSPGVCGVVTIDDGRAKAIPVKPGDSIWLSEQERIATANAPKRDEDNPFTNGTLVLVTPAAEIRNRRDIGPDELPPEGAPAPPEREPEATPPQPVPAAEEKPEPESEDREPTQVPTAADEAQKAKEAEAAQRAEAARKRAAQAKAQAEQPGKPVDDAGQPKEAPKSPVKASA